MKCYQMSSKMWSNVRLKMWPNVTENVGECHWMSSNVKKCRKMWLKCHKKVSWQNSAANFRGSEGSYHPSVGPQTLDSRSANNIFSPCLYRFSTIDRRSATSANFQALSWPLLDKLFSNNAGLWSVYRVIPASILVSIRFLNLSNANILARDSL